MSPAFPQPDGQDCQQPEALSEDRLTPERVISIVHTASRVLGFDTTGATRTKFTNNAVMVLPAAKVVLRIAGSDVMRVRIPAVIRAAQWYAEHDIPAVRLWRGIAQPLQIGPHLITVWEQVTPGGPQPESSDLGAILRAIHASSDPAPDLPTWRITEGIRHRLASAGAGTIDDDTRGYLCEELAHLQPAVEALRQIPPLVPAGVLHGDAHLGNLIPSPAGPVICDFDATSVGPREWDLTPAAVGSLRLRYPVDPHRGLVAAYGLDVMTWPGFPVLRRLRELQLVTSVLPTLAANPALRPQWQHRLDTFRSNDHEALWTPYADIVA